MIKNHVLIDIDEFINSAPPGTLGFDTVELGTAGCKTIFLLKEDPSRLGMIPENAFRVEIRSSLIMRDGVALMPLMLQFDNNPDLLYRGWFNYYHSPTAKECFRCLAGQDKLYLLVFTGEPEPARQISMNNNLQLWFKTLLPQLNNILPWSPVDYERVKFKIEGKYPTSISLWQVLGEKRIGR